MLYTLLLFVGAVVLAVVWWYVTIPSNLPPGPVNLPFIGVSHHLWTASQVYLQLTEWKNKFGPIYKFYIAEKLVVVLGDLDMIQEALVKQGDSYTGRIHQGNLLPKELLPKLGLVTSEGDLWKEHRRFALSTLRDLGFGRPILEPKIKDEIEMLLEQLLAQKKSFDPTMFLNNAVSNIIGHLVFGQRITSGDPRFCEVLQKIRKRLTEDNLSIVSPFVVSNVIAKMLRHAPTMKNFRIEISNTLKFIQSCVDSAAKDFDPEGKDEPENYVQAFYKARAKLGPESTFTEGQLLSSVNQLFSAGTDTTATTLRWAIFLLARNPEWQDKVYEEIKNNVGLSGIPNYSERNKLPLLNAVIMESQRLANLVPTNVLHRTTQASQLAGYDIPEGAVIVPLLTTVLFNPKIYPDPMKFDPTRFIGKDLTSPEVVNLIPFSTGKRACLGQSLAKMELFLFSVGLLGRMKFTFPDDEPKPPNEARVALIRGPFPYKIVVTSRSD